jgi:hypothetical protein
MPMGSARLKHSRGSPTQAPTPDPTAAPNNAPGIVFALSSNSALLMFFISSLSLWSPVPVHGLKQPALTLCRDTKNWHYELISASLARERVDSVAWRPVSRARSRSARQPHPEKREGTANHAVLAGVAHLRDSSDGRGNSFAPSLHLVRASEPAVTVLRRRQFPDPNISKLHVCPVP